MKSPTLESCGLVGGLVEMWSLQSEAAVTWGGGRGVMRFRLILLLQTTGYRTGEEGSKRMIRKWIRLSPFPLSHQPGKEIQRGNLRRENKQMEVSQNRN